MPQGHAALAIHILGDGPTDVVLHSGCNPPNNSRIATTRRQLRVRVTTDPEGGALVAENLTLTLNGVVIYENATWIALYSESYIYYREDASVIIVLNRGSDWPPGTTYALTIEQED